MRAISCCHADSARRERGECHIGLQERSSTVYGLSEYLLALEEVEKARLEGKARKARQGQKSPPTGKTHPGTMTNELAGGSDVSPTKNEILIGSEEGVYLPVLDIVHKVTAGASGGSLKVEEWGLPPGQMIPPHTHAREDECSYVLEGEMKCYVGGEVVLARQGSYVIKPRGVAHAFYNSGARTVRIMEILTPGGSFEGFFDEYEEIASQDMSDVEHRKARAELSVRYGITWHDERIREVRDLFGIDSEQASG
jgi:quercetin dioxygenase-like cupin family protein